MKVEIDGCRLTCIREKGDGQMKSGWGADPASMLLHRVKVKLNSIGFNLIKKRMAKDGHMTSDFRQYLRLKNNDTAAPHIYVTDELYQMRSACEDFRKDGKVTFTIQMNVTGKQPECAQMVAELAKKLVEE